MTKSIPLLLLELLIHITTLSLAQGNNFNSNKKYHPDSLKRWSTHIMNGLSKRHPGFYRYTSKERFDFLIDSTEQTINDSLTVLDYYRKLKPLFAQIGCLHTGISLSKEYQKYLDGTSTLIPLGIFIDSAKKVLIAKNYDSNQSVPVGAEIISINDRPISVVINQLLKSIPSDGYNLTEKILLLNHRFAFWYQTIIETTSAFKIEIKLNGINKTYELRGVSKEVFPTLESLEKNYEKALEFEVVNGVGILKIHSFAKTAIKESKLNFKAFIKNVFDRIEKEKVKILIVDLRNNTGGTDGNAAYLASYFFNKPFKYWDKIEVTKTIADEIKGLNRLFYKKPFEKNGSYQWRKTWLTKEFNYYEIQKPAKRNYPGQTYLITNGLCLSSCSDFVAILSQNKKAIIVGQETGGGFQGNTSGIMPNTTIPTGLSITIPLMKYTNAVDLSKNFGHGSKPDYEITTTFDDWIKNKDIEMEHILKLIKEK